MHNLPCVIFAGGKSSRMKKDKSLLPFGKYDSLAKFQYERLKKLFSKVYISTKENKFGFEADFIFDESKIFAPTIAFERIFQKFNEFFAISVDTPFVDEEIISKLIETFNKNKNYDAIIAKTTYIHPLVGIYTKSILPNITKEIENKNFKLSYILKNSNTIYVNFEDESKFFNINYPDDYKKALEKNF